MGITSSAYDAKARFSEILRQGCDGKTVTVSYRGKPVAEIRALHESSGTIEARLDDSNGRGSSLVPARPRKPMKPLKRSPGALKRFLAERGE